MTAAGRVAGLISGIGAFLFAAVGWVLAVGAGLPWLDALLVSALLTVLPALALAQLPLVRGAEELERVPAYLSSMVMLALVGGAAWLVGTRDAGPTGGAGPRGPAGVAAGGGVGLEPMAAVPLVLWVLGLTAAAFGVTVAFRWMTIRLGRTDPPLIHLLLPRTGREKAVFAGLSVFAGVGEELAFRGYLILVLAPVTGTLGAAAASTAVFGIIHAYQGTIGIARTGVLGAVLAWGFLASGSLWPPILAHTLVDLLAGLVFGGRLLVPARET